VLGRETAMGRMSISNTQSRFELTSYKSYSGLEQRIHRSVCAFCRKRRSTSSECAEPCPLQGYQSLVDQFSRGSHIDLDYRVYDVLSGLVQDQSVGLTVAQLAKSVDLSSSRLSHLFKRDTGTSIGVFLRVRRHWHVLWLLATTSKRVSEIAYSAGFADLPHFNRFFRRQLGITPTQFRKRIRSALAVRTTTDEDDRNQQGITGKNKQ
jgi:AraC family transcriptional regulator of arabinose operon